MRSLLRIASLAVTLALALPAQKPGAATVVEGDAGMRLDTAVTRAAPTFWGAVLVAIAGKPVLAKGYGLADRIKAPIVPGHLFDLGGASFQLTLAAALRVAGETPLRLEDPLTKYLPEWPVERSAMTLLDLAQHTSGLPAVLPWPPSGAQNAKNAVLFFARTPLAGRIGAEPLFSPGNGNLLALVLEAATQQRFEKLLLDRVCRPAGMTTALPAGQRGDAKLMTARRSPANERGEPADKMEANWSRRGASGVLASVLDVHALLAALTGGKFLTDEQRAKLWRPLAGDQYGVTALPGNGETMVRVHGATTGYRARWLVQPSSRSWLVILTEDYGNTDAVEAALAAEAWQAAAAAQAPALPAGPTIASGGEAPAAGAWPENDAARFLGTFELPRGGGLFRIERTPSGLQLAGIGLQASARLSAGRWPAPGEDRLRRAEDRGLALLHKVLADDRTVDAQGFESASVGATARQELREWCAKNGKPTRVDYAGTTTAGHGETWFRLLAGNAECFVRAAWNARGEWLRCAIAAEPFPFVVPLALVRTDVAVGTLAGSAEVVLTMEGAKAARRLVFEDSSPGAEGLLECTEAPAGR